MPNRIPPYFTLDRAGISPADLVRGTLFCEPEAILPRVVVTPCWQAAIFAPPGVEMTEVAPGRVYRLDDRGRACTLIRSGVGAPCTGDTILALGNTPCQELIFAGSAGGLAEGMQIGDLLLAQQSLCGDGFSRYLDEQVCPTDRFLQPVEPDGKLSAAVERQALAACAARAVPLHRGTVFSTDSIVAQFFRLDDISRRLGCAAIEMETAAVFGAARLVGIRAAALLQISDLPLRQKSLYAGRTEQETARRKSIRSQVLARIVLDSLLAW